MARRQLSDRNEGSATFGSARTGIAQQGLASAALAIIAFLFYYRTLLPGLDLGDSASFQAIAGSLTLNPRQAYPLYYALGNLFVWLHPGEPARAMNLASAVYGAVAAGAATWFAARLSESLLGGVAAGLFLAFSYTFWTQAITAEVYTLHLAVAGAAGIAIMSWAERPGSVRLAVFYAIVALGFGNHLSMVLVLPAFTAVLLMSRRAGAGDPFHPRMLLMAVAIAGAGALQYMWNFRGLWADLEPPATWADAFAKFWYDVTKQDWRETLVMTVSETGLQYRPAMYWFDVRQQFGLVGVALGAVGFTYVLWRWPRRAVFLLLFYAANMLFAWTYNVGDAYIFFLPAHYAVALSAGAGVAAIGNLSLRLWNRRAAAAIGAGLLMYPAWRAYDTLPAVDRSGDRRAEQLLDQFIADTSAVYAVDTNWQVQNAFEYFMRERRPGVPWFITDELLWLPERGREGFDNLVRANAEIGRRVIATDRVAERFMYPSSPPGVGQGAGHLLAHVGSLRPGTPYVLAVLRSDDEYPLDTAQLTAAFRLLAPALALPALRQYTAIVGRTGELPVLMQSEERPYRVRLSLEAMRIDLRMESWLPTDTIRRAGFGHVIIDGRHALTLERGISFMALDGGSDPVYLSGPFAPIQRHILEPRRGSTKP